MPIRQIQVSEYECLRCGYKWINRVNGKEGKMPKFCAKCKNKYWNGKGEGGSYTPITPEEKGLRTRLYKYEGRYQAFSYTPNELCKKFLGLNPRPTIKELREALYPLNYDTWKYRRNKYYAFKLVPDPDPNRPHKEGHVNLKIPDNNDEWTKTIEEETRLRRQVMKRVIESRGPTRG